MRMAQGYRSACYNAPGDQKAIGFRPGTSAGDLVIIESDNGPQPGGTRDRIG